MGGNETQHDSAVADRLLDTAPRMQRVRRLIRHVQRKAVRFSLLLVVLVMVFGITAGLGWVRTLPFAAMILLSSWFIAVSGQSYAMKRVIANRASLRIKSFCIGKKQFKVKNDLITTIEGRKLDLTEASELSLFFTACSVVTDHDPLDCVSEAFGQLDPKLLPGVDAVVRQFGPNRQQYVFVYGPLGEVLKHTDEIWDRGHVRKLTAQDKGSLEAASKKLSASSAFLPAFAYAPLEKDADPLKVESEHVHGNLIFLGLAGLTTAQGNRTLAPTVAGNHENVLSTSLTLFAATVALVLSSLLGLAWLQVPAALALVLLIALKIFTELPVLAALSWDKSDSRATTSRLPYMEIAWAGLLITGLVVVNYAWFFSRHGEPASMVESYSLIHAKAMSLSFLTITFCLIVHALQTRSHSGLFSHRQLHNRFFWIAVAFSLFWTANIIYNPLLNEYFATSPIRPIDWAYALAAAAIFTTVREVQRHANTHHTREHILELLKAK